MFPLRDDVPSSRFPILTLSIIALNVAAFFVEVWLGPNLQDFIFNYGVVPARYTGPGAWGHGSILPLFSSLFLLWIFGDNVEDRLGRVRYLALYLLGGLAASLLHIFTNPGSEIPSLGASGAIAAVMGAYFRLYPHARIEMVIPPFFFGPTFVVPAVLFLGWWFFLQFFNGTLSLLSPEQVGGIAWWAHIGGFAFGVLLGSVIKPSHFNRRQHQEELSW